MNTNLFHNILNFVAAIVAVLSVPEVVALIPLEWAAYIGGAIGTVKLLLNVLRDGVTGLAKEQPPVKS